MWKTPLAKWQIGTLEAVLYAMMPVAVTAYFTLEQARGAYPHNADTIIIPIYGFAQIWAWFLPVYAVLAALAVWKYKGGRALWSFNKAHPFVSGFWTLVWAERLWEAFILLLTVCFVSRLGTLCFRRFACSGRICFVPAGVFRG
jgi:hypothetical protein